MSDYSQVIPSSSGDNTDYGKIILHIECQIGALKENAIFQSLRGPIADRLNQKLSDIEFYINGYFGKENLSQSQKKIAINFIQKMYSELFEESYTFDLLFK